MRNIDVTWWPRRVDWNAHAWTAKTSLYWSVGMVDAVEWARVLCGSHIQDKWVEQQICIQFCIKLEHSSTETIPMIQKVTALGSWWLPALSRQCACSCLTSAAEFFCETSNHPGDSAPIQPRLGTQIRWLLSVPKTEITFEREEVSDHQWDSGKYGGAADGPCENCVRSQGAYFEGDWGIIVLCTMFHVSCTHQ